MKPNVTVFLILAMVKIRTNIMVKRRGFQALNLIAKGNIVEESPRWPAVTNPASLNCFIIHGQPSNIRDPRKPVLPSYNGYPGVPDFNSFHPVNTPLTLAVVPSPTILYPFNQMPPRFSISCRFSF